MSQPPNQPPPLPRPVQDVQLAYRTPLRGYALPTVWQALIGTIATAVLLVVGGFMVALAGAFLVAKHGDGTYFTVMGVIAAAVAGIGLLAARRIRRSNLYRGWAIGLYIGMGLAAAFWGVCMLTMRSMYQ